MGLDNRKISSHSADVRRKPGQLVPLEVAILDALVELRRDGAAEAHGYLIASVLRDLNGARRLTGYGTLYKALDRLEDAGALVSRWEEPDAAALERRPRRRYYRMTLAGETARMERPAVARTGSAVRRGAAAT